MHGVGGRKGTEFLQGAESDVYKRPSRIQVLRTVVGQCGTMGVTPVQPITSASKFVVISVSYTPAQTFLGVRLTTYKSTTKSRSDRWQARSQGNQLQRSETE
jgi:hypothetical protein